MLWAGSFTLWGVLLCLAKHWKLFSPEELIIVSRVNALQISVLEQGQYAVPAVMIL